jgi:hypothetical protein
LVQCASVTATTPSMAATTKSSTRRVAGVICAAWALPSPDLQLSRPVAGGQGRNRGLLDETVVFH